MVVLVVVSLAAVAAVVAAVRVYIGLGLAGLTSTIVKPWSINLPCTSALTSYTLESLLMMASTVPSRL